MARINLQVSGDLIPQLFMRGVRGYEVTKDAVPDDAYVVDMTIRRSSSGIVILVELESRSTPHDCVLVPELTRHLKEED